MKIKTFWADRSGAVASEFVMLTTALLMGVSVTLTTLTASLEAQINGISTEVFTSCSRMKSPGDAHAADLNKATCR